jgi:hypothetical protein
MIIIVIIIGHEHRRGTVWWESVRGKKGEGTVG